MRAAQPHGAKPLQHLKCTAHGLSSRQTAPSLGGFLVEDGALHRRCTVHCSAKSPAGLACSHPAASRPRVSNVTDGLCLTVFVLTAYFLHHRVFELRRNSNSIFLIAVIPQIRLQLDSLSDQCTNGMDMSQFSQPPLSYGDPPFDYGNYLASSASGLQFPSPSQNPLLSTSDSSTGQGTPPSSDSRSPGASGSSMVVRRSPAQRQRLERRGHTKSRRGCYNCKRRRIKV